MQIIKSLQREISHEICFVIEQPLTINKIVTFTKFVFRIDTRFYQDSVQSPSPRIALSVGSIMSDIFYPI